MRPLSACLLFALVATAHLDAQSTTTSNTTAVTPSAATATSTPTEHVVATPSANVAEPIATRPAGPSLASERIGLTEAAPALTPPAPRRTDTSRNRALMIVGGAALVVGAVIGGTPGTLVMLGGAVTGLYGLYKFLE